MRPVLALSLSSCAAALAGLTGCSWAPPEPAAVSIVLPLSPRQAGQKGLDYLLASATQWQQEHRCFGCHVQGVALMGAAVAQANAYRVDGALVDELLDQARRQSCKGVRLVLPASPDDGRSGGGAWKAQDQVPVLTNPGAFTASFHAGVGLAYMDRFHVRSCGPWLEEKARAIADVQNPDGSFPEGRVEPPVDQGAITVAASCLVTLDQADPDGHDPQIAAAAGRAYRWLRRSEPFTIQDHAFRILGLTWREHPDAGDVVARAARSLAALQQVDGGWPEVPGRRSNAYATGLALYALKLAGIPVTDKTCVAGTLFLLGTQLPDGAWELADSTSRRPSRFASTMYAVIGLGGVFDLRAEEEFLSLFRARKSPPPISGLSLLLYLAFPAIVLAITRAIRW